MGVLRDRFYGPRTSADSLHTDDLGNAMSNSATSNILATEALLPSSLVGPVTCSNRIGPRTCTDYLR